MNNRLKKQSPVNDLIARSATRTIREFTNYGVVKEHILFAGFFGSQVKGYAGRNSDYDVHVVYLNKPEYYLKALNVDGPVPIPKLPTQITHFYDSVGDIAYINPEKTPSDAFKIQYNFVEFTEYVKGLTQTYFDYRYSLHNVFYNGDEDLIPLLQDLARSFMDRQKLRVSSYNRAARYVAAYEPFSKAMKPSNSELWDALHSFLLGVRLLSRQETSEILQEPTISLYSLLHSHSGGNQFTNDIHRELHAWMHMLPDSRDMIDTDKVIVAKLTNLIERYPLKLVYEDLYESDQVHRTIETRMAISLQINRVFASMVKQRY